MNTNPMSLEDSTDFCPHLERGDARCSAHLRLGHLDEAFSNCCGDFHACPAFDAIEGSTRSNRSGAFLRLSFASDLRIVAAAAAVAVAVSVDTGSAQTTDCDGTTGEFQHSAAEFPHASQS